VRRIGVLMGYAEGNAEGQAFVAAFRRLRELVERILLTFEECFFPPSKN
jgi:hypothetical protein